MVTITLAGELEGTRQEPLLFRIPARSVLLAGSRNGAIDPQEAECIAGALGSAVFSFPVGCATGVDACFRLTLAERLQWSDSAFVACAFDDRAGINQSLGLVAITTCGSAAERSEIATTAWSNYGVRCW